MPVLRSNYSVLNKENISEENKYQDLRSPQRIIIDTRNIIRIILLFIFDILAITLGYYLAVNYYTKNIWLFPEQTGSKINLLFASILVLSISLLLIFQAYKRGNKSRNFINLSKAITLTYLSLMPIGWQMHGKLFFVQLILAWLITLVLINSGRFLIFQLLLELRKKYSPMKINVLLIGDKEDMKKCIPLLVNSQEFQFFTCLNCSRFANSSQLISAFEQIDLQPIGEILICSWEKIKYSKKFLWKLRCSGIYWRILNLQKPTNPKALEISDQFEGIESWTISDPPIVGINFLSKRIFDLIASFILLVVLILPMLVVALLIKLDSPGPVFYRQTRVGLKGKHFKVWKFRTMVQDANQLQQQLEAKNEISGGVLFKMKDDPRITRIGKYLRKYSIDELPQLFNVLLGEMSLVGPRPLPVRDVKRFSPEHYFRHEVVPGITGLWQVSGRSNMDSEDAFNLDFEYIQNWTLALDFQILYKTIQVVLSSKGAY